MSTAAIPVHVALVDSTGTVADEVGGVKVSDFLAPAFYRSSTHATPGYSHTGDLTEPLQIADGGYISFLDPADGHVWQRFVRDGQVSDRDWGVQDLGGDMLRQRSDQLAAEFRASV